MDHHDKILEMLTQKDEITWQTIIQDLVKSDEMDPWDVNISQLTKKYISTIKHLEKLDFRVVFLVLPNLIHLWGLYGVSRYHFQLEKNKAVISAIAAYIGFVLVATIVSISFILVISSRNSTGTL